MVTLTEGPCLIVERGLRVSQRTWPASASSFRVAGLFLSRAAASVIRSVTYLARPIRLSAKKLESCPVGVCESAPWMTQAHPLTQLMVPSHEVPLGLGAGGFCAITPLGFHLRTMLPDASLPVARQTFDA